MTSHAQYDPDELPLLAFLIGLLRSLWGRRRDTSVLDAVITMVSLPRAAKLELVADLPELDDIDAEWLLDQAADWVRRAQTADPAGHPEELVKALIANRDLLRHHRGLQVTPDLLKRVDQATASEEKETGQSLLQRGDMLEQADAYEEALSCYSRASDWAREHGDRLIEGVAALRMHDVHFLLTAPGPTRHALQHRYASRAEAIFTGETDDSLLRAAVVRLIGIAIDTHDRVSLERHMTRLDEVDASWGRWWRRYAEAMTTSDRQARTSGLTWCRDNAEMLGEEAEYWRNQCQTKLTFIDGPLAPVNGETLSVSSIAASLAALDGGPGSEAETELSVAIRNIERIRRRIRSQSGQRELSAAYEIPYTTMAALHDQADRPGRLLDTLELNTSRSLGVQDAMTRLWWEHPTVVSGLSTGSADEDLAYILSRFRATPTPHNRHLLTLAFKRERQTLHRIEQELINDTVTGGVLPAPTRSDELAEHLEPDDAVVRFTPSGSIIMLDRNGARALARFRAGEIKQACVSLRDTTPDATRHDDPDAVTTVVRKLIDPIRAAVPAGGRVFLIPHEAMWRISLVTVGESPLAASHRVSYVPNLTVLSRLLTSVRLRRRIERFVGVGDPDGSLRSARDEIEHAASCFSDSMTFLGSDFTAGSAKANLADADVAHLGCHGFSFPEYPDFSGLHLAGTSADPKIWWYYNVARFRMTARLVVLAACHAGTGSVAYGKEYIGLPGAFLAAGAATVVAPLWAVDDLATSSIMGAFYPALLKSGSAAEALASSSLQAGPAGNAFQVFGLP